MARKAPKIDVIKKLCILSKNQCAFPGCHHTILNENGEYIAQLCHIEAAEKGGERYNENQTDEERNLICYFYVMHIIKKQTTLPSTLSMY